MKLSASDEKTYPRLYEYVKNKLPTVLTRPRISSALETIGRLTPTEAKDALAYGNDPSITIAYIATPVVFAHGRPEIGGRTFGQFDPANPNAIEINKQLVMMYETFPTGRLAFKIGATLLHEMVHWSNYHHHQAHSTVDVLAEVGFTERGWMFEKAAYGSEPEHFDFMP